MISNKMCCIDSSAGLGGIGGIADGLLSNPYKKENQMLRLDNTGYLFLT